MQKVFDEVGSLDRRCFDEFELSEAILMEHAAQGMAAFIRKKFPKNSKVLVVCGTGNNGADGIALARLLFREYDVHWFMLNAPKSPMAILQHSIAHKIGMRTTLELNECDVLVDALFGTGFNGELDYEAKAVMQTINKRHAYKISCDIPSGLQRSGECDKYIFKADTTLTMGALKKAMFSDQAKEYVGHIKVLDLGIARKIYETSSRWNLLDEEDLVLPHRGKKDTHKGTYGHLAIACGEKTGASIISGLAALNFGSGLVTLISKSEKSLALPYVLMCAQNLPSSTTAIACGMGLGNEFYKEDLTLILDNELPLLVDADLCYKPIIVDILKKKNVVITPHPKEFVSVLKLVGLADISVEELQNNRFKYSEEFCLSYPDVTLVLKGANVLIGKSETYFINPHGNSVLAKGGSGDVLSGLIGALLAQGSRPIDAALNGSLAHTLLAKKYAGANFSLTPDDLIEGISAL
jgi:hydroxyethylthiazole kinase-like uncharacterized protein yjeF